MKLLFFLVTTFTLINITSAHPYAHNFSICSKEAKNLENDYFLAVDEKQKRFLLRKSKQGFLDAYSLKWIKVITKENRDERLHEIFYDLDSPASGSESVWKTDPTTRGWLVRNILGSDSNYGKVFYDDSRASCADLKYILRLEEILKQDAKL